MNPARETSALRAGAARLAGLIPRERLESSVLVWAEAAPRQGIWSVAVSGGPDSLALLLLLWAHWPERRRTLRVLHFDHRLRGAESRADAVFCRNVCAKLGVKFIAGTWPGTHRDASEAEARAVRMAFFEKHGRSVWLGHQQDDIAESMLMRLARGSGTGGLAAPRPVQKLAGGRMHLRPLLTLKKTEIVAALRDAGLAWRTDLTNRRGTYFRNRIRNDVLPLWSVAAQRDALGGAARSRLLLEEDDAALDTWLDAIRPLERRGRLDLVRLVGKPRALFRRAIHRWLLAEPRAGAISRQAFDALLLAVERGKPTRHSIGREGFAVIDRDGLRFEPVGKRRRNFQRPAN
ncbi:MAG: tRNA lysidine(34) synthetase TilS [Opitutus sp.]|nr:tRNA lysidine(34) synthetase TilS [Opitutus sp.]